MSEHDPIKKAMREERDALIRDRLRRGVPVEVLARRMGVDGATVRAAAKAAGIALQTGKAAPEGYGAGVSMGKGV